MEISLMQILMFVVKIKLLQRKVLFR
jgi:hypothetical protein